MEQQDVYCRSVIVGIAIGIGIEIEPDCDTDSDTDFGKKDLKLDKDCEIP